MKKITLKALIGVLLLSACNNTPVTEDNVTEIDIYEASKDSMEIWDMYSDVKFIPLENSLPAMIYYGSKIEVSDSSIYVMDMDEIGASVKRFGIDGRYKNNIGRSGHGRGEYQNIADFTASQNGDTVVLATFTELMAYSQNGEYLFSSAPFDGYKMKRIQKAGDGYLCSTEYSDENFTLHYLDAKLNVKREYFPTNGVVIGLASLVDVPIRFSGQLAYFYDSYTSVLHRFDPLSPESSESVHFLSPYALSLDKFSKADVYDSDMDHMSDFIVTDDKILGHVRMTKPTYSTPLFTYCFSSHKLALHYNRWYSPRVMTAHKGMHYALIPQEEFVNLRQAMEHYRKSGTLVCNYFDVADTVNEKSNSILMIAKPKDK